MTEVISKKAIGERHYGIDLIKIVAALLVIVHHHLSSVGFYSMIFGSSKSLYIYSMIQSITLTCVPLFLMATGYLLSDRKISKNHYVKIIFFLIEVFVIYTIGTLVYQVLISKVPLQKALIDYILLLLAPNNYVNLYTTLFFFAPFYNKLYFSLDKSEKKYLLIVVVLFISLIRLQNLIPHFIYYSGWPTASYPALYYFIGLYIKDHQPEFKKKNLMYLILLTSITYSIFFAYYMRGRTFYYLLGHYEGVFTMILTTLIFLLLYNVNISNLKQRSSIKLFSSMTLSFYLLGGNFTDKLALKFMTLFDKPLYNLITFAPKLFLSSLFILPVAYIIHLLLRKIINPLLLKLVDKILSSKLVTKL